MTAKDELIWLPAYRTAELIAARELSAREVTEAAIARAEGVQPAINCMAIPLFDEARQQADAADQMVAAGEALGPLHGVPLTIKDGFATAGHRSTFGSRAMAQNISTVDDPVWQRLRAAGTILIGKTTTPEFFHKVSTDSSLYGVTRNPWATDRTPGGSSGGAAAALASGVGSLAVGSDGGGSLRCPAACTGVLALKPTMGVVPSAGGPDSFGNYAAVGPMARTARDLALMLAAMAGEHRNDAASLGRSLRPDPKQGRPLRIGWVANPAGETIEPGVSDATATAIARLEASGHCIVPLQPALFADAFAPFEVIASVGYAARSFGQPPEASALWTDSFRALAAHGLSYSAGQLQQAQQGRTKLFRAAQDLFEQVDLVATPTLTGVAPSTEADGAVGNTLHRHWAVALYPFNLTGHPAISVPCGFSTGLPVGLQLVAPWFGEQRLLWVAALLEELFPELAEEHPSL